jgi:hypothetical protein
MIPVAGAIGTVLEVLGIVWQVEPYVDAILKITAKGENISQADLDAIIATLNQRSGQIQSADPDRT